MFSSILPVTDRLAIQLNYPRVVSLVVAYCVEETLSRQTSTTGSITYSGVITLWLKLFSQPTAPALQKAKRGYLQRIASGLTQLLANVSNSSQETSGNKVTSSKSAYISDKQSNAAKRDNEVIPATANRTYVESAEVSTFNNDVKLSSSTSVLSDDEVCCCHTSQMYICLCFMTC